MNIQEVLAIFKEAGFSGKVYRNHEDFRKALEAEPPVRAISCPYNGRYRDIHPKVCEWHKAENDPECQECRPTGKNVRKNASVTWDPADLPPGEYLPDVKGGWKRTR
ncbi:MAG: hypothetical protein V1930_05455 [Pseudomonadota bacterium]